MTIFQNRRFHVGSIAAGLIVCALAASWLLGGVQAPHAQNYANYSEGHYEDGKGGLYYLVEENQTENLYYYNTKSGALRSLCEQPDCRHHNEQVEDFTCGIEQETLDGVFYNGYFYCLGGTEDVQENATSLLYYEPDDGLYRMHRPDAEREPVFLLEQIQDQFQIGKDYNTLTPRAFCMVGDRVYITLSYQFGTIVGRDERGVDRYDGGSAGYLCSYDLQTGAFEKHFMAPGEGLYTMITDGQALYISSYEIGASEVYSGDTLMLPQQYDQERIYRYDLETGEHEEIFTYKWEEWMYGAVSFNGLRMYDQEPNLHFNAIQNGKLYFYCLGSGWYLDLQTGQATKFEKETAEHYAVLEDRIVAPRVYDVTPDIHADLSILDLDGRFLREQKTKYTFTDLWPVNGGKDVMVRFVDKSFEDYEVRKQMTTKYRYPSEDMNCVRFMGILSEDRLRGDGIARAALLERDVISGVKLLREAAQ